MLRQSGAFLEDFSSFLQKGFHFHFAQNCLKIIENGWFHGHFSEVSNSVQYHSLTTADGVDTGSFVRYGLAGWGEVGWRKQLLSCVLTQR